MWITHCCSDPSMCSSLSQPDPPPGLRGIHLCARECVCACVCVCVCVTDTERACIGQKAYARRCVFIRACVCVCVSSRSGGESRWDEGHMWLNTHLVIKQLLGGGFSQNPPRACVVEGIIRQNKQLSSMQPDPNQYHFCSDWKRFKVWLTKKKKKPQCAASWYLTGPRDAGV